MTITKIDPVETRKKKRQSRELSSIAVNVKGELVKYLEEKNIDMQSLSLEQRYDILTKFLETSYDIDKDLLPEDMKRDAIAKQNYFLDELLHDQTLGSYTKNTQGSVPMTQAIAIATLNKLLELSWLPASMIQDLQDLGQQSKDTSIFGSLDAFRTRLQNIINKYDGSINPNADPKLTVEQLQYLNDVSIDNNAIIAALKDTGNIDEDTYNTLKTQNYEKRPDDYKKAFATQLRKQFTYHYADHINTAKQTSDGISGLIQMPKLRDVLASYCKKMDVEYSDMMRQSPNGLDFSTWSTEEKQSLLDIMVEEYYIPNADKYAATMGLDPKQYKQFVKQLFTLNQNTLTIPGSTGNNIELSFLQKDISGLITIDGADIGDDPIPLDFVVDGADEHQMQKLFATMPHKDRISINGIKYDPKQQLRAQVHGQAVPCYAYKIMHDGEEKSILTQESIMPGQHTDSMPVLIKDGTYKPLNQTQAEDVIMLNSDKSVDNNHYPIAAQEPIKYGLAPHDIPGILTAYCLNNTSQLTDAQKAQLYPDKQPNANIPDLFADKLLKNQNPKDTSDQTPEEKNTKIKEAKEAWNNLPGWNKTFDQGGFVKGTQIALQCVDSIFKDIPGTGGFMILEIVDADDWDNPTKFKYKIVGGSETDINSSSGGSLTGQTSDMMDFSKEFFSKLRDFGRGTIFKLPPNKHHEDILDYANAIDFGEYNQNNDLKNKFHKLERKGNKLHRKTGNNAGDIKYFGTKVTKYDKKGVADEKHIMFAVDMQGDKITVKDPKGGYKHTMNYAQFMLFAADKGLYPYTEGDYKDLVGEYQNNHSNSKSALYRFSPMDVFNGCKNWRQNGYLAARKKAADRRAEKIEEFWYTSGINKTLGRLPFVGEMFVQAEFEFETKMEERNYKLIMEGDQTLNQRGKKVVWGKKTFIDKHNKKGPYRREAHEKIISLFKKAGTPGGLTDGERREAFGALLYVLEKFQTTYPMFIAEYAGQNLWAKMLLSPSQYQKYEEGFNESKARVEAGLATGDEIREFTEDLVQYDTKVASELLKDKDLRSIYSDKAVKELQKSMDVRSNDTARKDGFSSAKNHTSFNQAFTQEIDDKIRDGRMGYVVGALVQVSSRKEMKDPQNYRRWMSALLSLILSGGLKYATNSDDKKYLRDFLRKHGFPIGDLILDNSQGGSDLATLLDLFSTHAKCSSDFSTGVGWNKDIESYEKWSANKNHHQFFTDFNKWFLGQGNATKIIPFLENSNMAESVNIATIAADPSLDRNQKRVLTMYINSGLNAHPGRDYDNYPEGVANTIQERTIFNTSRQLLQMEYMNYSSGGTFNKNEETVQSFWGAFKDHFQTYVDKEQMSKESVTMVIKKYYSLFQQSYSPDHRWFPTMLAYIKNTSDPEQKKVYARAAVSEYIKKNSYGVFPQVMKSAFENVEEFLVKHIGNVDASVIESVISFEELDATTSQRKEGLEAFETMDTPNPARTRPKEHKAVQDYMKKLLAGQLKGGNNEFKGFDTLVDNKDKGEGAYLADQQMQQQREQEEQADNQQKKGQFTTLIEQGDAAMNNANFDEAINLYTQAQQLGVDDGTASSKINEANNKKQQAQQEQEEQEGGADK